METINDSTAHIAITSALKETLRRTGTLDEVRARLRSTILRCMGESLQPTRDPDGALARNPSPSRPAPPVENVLIDELVAEYLAFNGYAETLSVFIAETGWATTQASGASFGRSVGNENNGTAALGEAFIRAELGLDGGHNVINNGTSLAMLYEIVGALKAKKQGEQH